MPTREEILALRPPTEAVELDGLGPVHVKGLTASERDAYEQTLIETSPDGRSRVKRVQRNVRAALVVRCVLNDKGERMFTDKDTEFVGNMDGAVVDKLWDVARRLSGMSEAAVEEAAEDFDTAQDDGSSTELP